MSYSNRCNKIILLNYNSQYILRTLMIFYEIRKKKENLTGRAVAMLVVDTANPEADRAGCHIMTVSTHDGTSLTCDVSTTYVLVHITNKLHLCVTRT
jgi:hypothetical protein